jgi:hypothetical protein
MHVGWAWCKAGMSGLSKEQLELEINTLFKNIELGIALGLDISESQRKLTLYRSDLLAFILAEDEANTGDKASMTGHPANL